MPAALYKDLWLSGSMLAVLGVSVALFFIRPTGEGWGYGWNMVAFLLYASPAALLASAAHNRAIPPSTSCRPATQPIRP